MGKKVVLDTNVWVSTLLSKALAKTFVPLIESKRVEVSLSYELLREMAKVLTYPKIDAILRTAEVSQQAAFSSIIKSVKLLRPRESVSVVKEDPTHDRVLECAYAAKAKFIVGGDHHLLVLKEYRWIRNLKPKEFLRVIRKVRGYRVERKGNSSK